MQTPCEIMLTYICDTTPRHTLRLSCFTDSLPSTLVVSWNVCLCALVSSSPVAVVYPVSALALLGGNSDIGILVSARGVVRDIGPASSGSGFALISHGSLSGSGRFSYTRCRSRRLRLYVCP